MAIIKQESSFIADARADRSYSLSLSDSILGCEAQGSQSIWKDKLISSLERANQV